MMMLRNLRRDIWIVLINKLTGENMNANNVVMKLKELTLPGLSCFFAMLAYLLELARHDVTGIRNLVNNLKELIVENNNSIESTELFISINERLVSITSGLTISYGLLVVSALFCMVRVLVRKGNLPIKVITFFIVTWFTIYSMMFSQVT